uniref:Aryl-sulfate sulfotransferase n=1 Tax=Prevotella sp. GTC17262 TaxID=3236797 RepID=A0AB33JDU9_9BACT
MKFKSHLAIFISVFSLLCSCGNTDENTNHNSATLIDFQVQLTENNTLRAEVKAKFSKSVSYYIEYWETSKEDTRHHTLTYETYGATQDTLVLLKPHTEYACRIVYNDAKDTSPVKHFNTKEVPSIVPTSTLITDNLKETLDGYLLSYSRKSPGVLYLMDTKGIPVWYEKMPEGVLVANFNKTNNCFYVLSVAPNSANPDISGGYYTGDKLKVIDLFGHIRFQKLLTTLPEMKNRHAHHECRPLPNGNVMIVTSVTQSFDLTAQGGTKDEEVTGDGFIVLNPQGKVVYQWDCFGTLNPADDSGIMQSKKDWLHANSINTDMDGNYYMTFNTISQLWKIDAQTGKTLYRIGKNGTIKTPEEGWANGLHCANPMAPDEILALDNGRMGTKGSRALLYKINTKNNTVQLAIDSEISKEYSTPNRGNVQLVTPNMLLFGSSVKNLILFTDINTKANMLRAISVTNLFYRTEYIPSISY